MLPTTTSASSCRRICSMRACWTCTSASLYAVLLRLVSPGLLLRGAALRWSSFHRGTSLRTHSVTRNSATIVLEHPQHLFDPMGLRATAMGFKAALDASGAESSRVEVAEAGSGRARFEGTWD